MNDVRDIDSLVEQALRYKSSPGADKSLGIGKRIGLLFLNPSMRTRVSTQVAAANLGMEIIVVNVGSEGWQLETEEGAIMNGTTVEHIKDAAPVLGSYFDMLGVRTFPKLQNREEDYSEQVINALIKYAGVPVVSLESTTLHPLQSLADLVTIRETFDNTRKPKVVMTWAPHVRALPQCVANSFAQWMTAWGNADFVITHPRGYELFDTFTRGATIEYDRNKALAEADYVYVKNWSSYSDYGNTKGGDASWMPTQANLSAAPHAQIMHCLPVRRNVELSDELLDGENSLVTRQAANRVWAAQVVLAEILKSM